MFLAIFELALIDSSVGQGQRSLHKRQSSGSGDETPRMETGKDRKGVRERGGEGAEGSGRECERERERRTKNKTQH